MSQLSIRIVHFATGKPKKMTYDQGQELETAICKTSTEEAFLSKDGFVGDGVADLKHHGGLDRAVCFYPHEHYNRWNQEFQTNLPKSTFGENLTVTNMLEQDIHIGDIFRLGGATIQITQGRIPCSTITKRVGIPALLKSIVNTGFTGYLARVLEEGTVRHDSTITLVEPHPNRVSILFANDIYFRGSKDMEGMERILQVQELADEWKQLLNKRIAKLKGTL